MTSFPHPKILVVLAGRLGDTIFCTPAIHFLHKKFPDVQIDALVLTSLAASVLTNNPAIKNIFIADQDDGKKIVAQYSLVICLHRDGKTMPYVSEATQECWIVPEYSSDLTVHSSTKKLKFLEDKLGCETFPESKQFFLYPQNKDQERINTILTSRGIDAKQNRLIGCHLGCHGLSKRGFKFWRRFEHRKAWSLNNYIKLVRQLRKLDPQIRVVLTGTKNEIALGKKLMRKEKHCIDLIGNTSVQEMATLMSHLTVFVTGDTGPLHVACTTPVNLVVLYGANVTPQIPPYPRRTNHSLIQAATVGDIKVEEVYQAIAGLLTGTN